MANYFANSAIGPNISTIDANGPFWPDYTDYLVDWAIYIVQNKNLGNTKPQLGPVRKDPAQTIFS